MDSLPAGLKGVPLNLAFSPDPFTCTLTRTEDGIPLDRTDTYQSSLDAYVRWEPPHRQDRSPLHVFRAKVNAAHVESRLVALGLPQRLLDARVTALLEEMAQVRLFLRCWAFGVVRQTYKDLHGIPNGCFMLTLPDPARVAGAAVEHLLTEPGPGSPDAFEALRACSLGPFDGDRLREALEEARHPRIDEMLGEPQAVLHDYVEGRRNVVAA